MTRRQLRRKFGFLASQVSIDLDNLFEKAILSGAIDIDGAKNDYLLPRIILKAVLLRTAEKEVFHPKHQREVNNLGCFL